MVISAPCKDKNEQSNVAAAGGIGCPPLLAAILNAYSRPLRPGFWQLSAGGVSVNLDDSMMARFKASGSPGTTPPREGTCSTLGTPAWTSSSGCCARSAASPVSTRPKA